MINVALLSRWHVHADDYANQAKNNPDFNIQLVWDEDVDRGRDWADELGVSFESELENVLANPDIDAVIVATPTNLHKEVIIAAAKHKKHIFTEKVLGLTVDECEEILTAVKDNDVHLMVSLPRLRDGYYLAAQEAVNKGILGDLTMIRCRVAHNGAVNTDENPSGWLPDHFFDEKACGGGAFIDLGAHSIYLTNRLAGKVTALSSRLQKMDKEVDVNAVVLTEYESGALGVLETAFVSGGSPFQLELYGTKGTLLVEDQDVRWRQHGGEWTTPETMPEELPMPMEQWAKQIITGEEPFITKEDAYQLTLVNDMARLSNQENRRVEREEVYQ